MPKLWLLFVVAVLTQQPDWPIRPILVPLDGLEKGSPIGAIDKWDRCQPAGFDPKSLSHLTEPARGSEE
jgi:hypothetical protein